MKAIDLDEMLGAPARLAIMATVASLPVSRGVCRWTFTSLGQETGLADGNLHVQTRKLVGAGYLHSHRVKHGNRQVTCFGLTEVGRQALKTLINRLREALQSGPGFSDLNETKPQLLRGADDSRVW